MKKQLKINVLLVLFIASTASAETFLKKKEKPKKAQSSECAEISGDIVRRCNEAIAQCAKIQQQCINNVECIIEGEKKPFFCSPDYQAKLIEIEQMLDDAVHELRKAHDQLATLEAKTTIKKP